jgi:anthranilate/para-aminobenzoate synthase component I
MSSEKGRAEHVMLVDLGRNDLSRVCRPGTVQVVRFLEAERFSQVTHLGHDAGARLEQRQSDPAAEHDECLQKLAALETAIELAEARA